jgi:hypothetical protein
VRHFFAEYDGEPLGLLSAVDADDGNAGETFVERAIRTRGAFFPGDYR